MKLLLCFSKHCSCLLFNVWHREIPKAEIVQPEITFVTQADRGAYDRSNKECRNIWGWGGALDKHRNWRGLVVRWNKYYSYYFKNKNISKKIKLMLKNKIIDKTLTYALETLTLTKRDWKQLNTCDRKVYRRILDALYGNEKGNFRLLINEVIYANIKKPTLTETIRLHEWQLHVLSVTGTNKYQCHNFWLDSWYIIITVMYQPY